MAPAAMPIHAPRLATTLLFAAALAAQRPLTPAAPAGEVAGSQAQRQVEGLIRAARDGDALAYWQWLPASYRSDLEGLVREFGRRVEARAWDRSMQLAGRIADLAIGKERFLFHTPEVQQALALMPERQQPSRETIRAVMQLVRDLGGSDLRTASGLREFDGERFLRGSGKKLLAGVFAIASTQGKDPLAEFAGATVRTLRQDRDRVRLEVTTKNDREVDDYVLVEDRWLPEALVRDWPAAMQKARAALRQLPEGGNKELTARFHLALGVVEGFVRRFEDCDTQDEFDAVMADVAALLEREKSARRR